jgi:hypothetical protein
MRPPEDPALNVLIPYDPREGCTLQQAAARAGKPPSTIKNWCQNRGIGRRVGGGVWVVSRVALEMFLDGDAAALLAYHQGERAGTLVRPYFERVGLLPKLDDIAAAKPATSTKLATFARISG